MRTVRFGLLFGLLTLVYGFGLGAAFGAVEDDIKGHLKAGTEDKKVSDKAWVYMKRAHLHANGLGTAAIALSLLLAFLPGRDRARALLALASGVGGLGYALYWMLAGLRAPGLGSTGAAKESLEWLAIPTSGLCIVGLVGTLVLVAITLLPSRRS